MLAAGGKSRQCESEKKSVAQALLTSRLGDIEKGLVVNPKVGKITVREALQAVVDDMIMNSKRSIAHTQRRIDKHIQQTVGTEIGHFHPDRYMSTITTADLSAYVAHRLAQKPHGLVAISN